MFGDLRGFDPARFQGLEWFQQMLDEMFPETGATDIRSVPRGTFPMINVGRTDDAVRVYVFAPGLGPEALDVSIQDNVLTVSGKREAGEASAESGSPRTRFRRERFQGEFRRSLALPDGLDIERAEAHFRDGVCEIVLPRREELKPRRIEVQVA
ncbi:Hsp20/alpha crystallin family protein [Halomonas sp.]|uniref:Hsp20/alpha crystallin family protein n=1 Tax=Halomonas sp. TaxID=1486246 RepID=UPI00262670F5|nr:Hsp20/alpha crystallin family protein [Halomonas sp.]